MEQTEQDKETPQLIRNAWRTPDGTVIESRHRHDFVTHVDANGEEYMVDGGLDYIRANVNKEPAESMCLYDTEPHSVQRDVLTWGTYGKNGDESLTYKKISEMTSNHIKAVLAECPVSLVRKVCMERELVERGTGE